MNSKNILVNKLAWFVLVMSACLALRACGDKAADSPNNTPPLPAVGAVVSASASASVEVETETPVGQVSATVIDVITPTSIGPLATAGTINPGASATAQILPTSSPAPTLAPLPVQTVKPPTPITPTPATPVALPSPTRIPSGGVQTGYIKGHIVAGPTCPVERADNPCPPRPVAGRMVQVKDQRQTTVLKTLTTDTSGYFSVELLPGDYLIALDATARPLDRNGPHPVRVVAGRTTSLEIMLDTGIR